MGGQLRNLGGLGAPQGPQMGQSNPSTTGGAQSLSLPQQGNPQNSGGVPQRSATTPDPAQFDTFGVKSVLQNPSQQTQKQAQAHS